MSVRISERLIVQGPRHFTEDLAIPIAEMIEGLGFTSPPDPEDMEWDKPIPAQPTALVTPVEGVVTISLFFSAWAAKKALDELYDHTLKPKLQPILEKFFASQRGAKRYAIAYAMRNTPSKVTVLIVAIGSSAAEVDEAQLCVPKVIDAAFRRAMQTASTGLVHLYRIEDGKYSSEPEVYVGINQALRSLKSMDVAAMPKRIS